MAKKDKPKLNYNGLLRELKEQGPRKLYLLYGAEDYLRECFLGELRSLCVSAEDDFGYHRLYGPAVNPDALAEAVDALPFFGERSFVEVRDWDLNKCREAELERLKAILSDLPDYCTLAFVQSVGYEPDGRLGLIRTLKKEGTAIEFSEQEQGTLTRWILTRFSSFGKTISPADAEYLIFLCGTRMNALIPEIEKIAAFAKGNTVQRSDIDATANRIPEADVFRMTDLLAQRRYDLAAGVLSDLMADKNNHPIMLNALISQQLRRMYAVKVGQEAGRRRSDLMELCGLRYDFIFDKLLTAVRPYSAAQLGTLVKLCAEYDYRMKSSGVDAGVLLRELFARIAAGV